MRKRQHCIAIYMPGFYFLKKIPLTSFYSSVKLSLIGLFAALLCLATNTNAQKTLGMTKHRSGSTENGYVLYAPMGSKTTYLIDKCGKKVHSWTSKYNPGLSAYLLEDGSLLRTGVMNDTFFVFSGKGGIIEKFDWDGNLVWSYVISNDSLCQHHDIHPLKNGNILVIAWHGISANDAYAKGRQVGSIGGPKLASERIIELKPKGINGAEIVWQWSLWDHIIQDESISKPDFNVISNHPELMNINYAPFQIPDWIHMNSIDYNPDLDQIVVSCHSNSEIWIIDHSTTTAEAASHVGGKANHGGDLLYRWGNPAAYNKGTKSNQKFFRQHNAYWIPKGYLNGGDIMAYNNGLGRTPNYSQIDIIRPPVNSFGEYVQSKPYGPTNALWTYKDSIPTNFYSAVTSGAQRLRNGNTLICEGSSGRFFEIKPNNTIVWEYWSPVAMGDFILSDGDEPSGTNVFRCTWYSDSFSGFNGKILTAGDPIEKNSKAYSCTLDPGDTKAPNVVDLFPSNHTSNILINTTVELTFNENIQKGDSGAIYIYENQWLKERIPISSSQIQVNNTMAVILPSSVFDYNSKIQISVSKDAFKDIAGNHYAGSDSSNWSFTTEAKLGVIEYEVGGNQRIYPNPAKSTVHIPVNGSHVSIDLVNQLGQIIAVNHRFNSNNEAIIDISSLSPGIYSVLVNKQFKQSLIKN